MATQQIEGVDQIKQERPSKRTKLNTNQTDMEPVNDSQSAIDPALRSLRTSYPDPETLSLESVVDDQESLEPTMSLSGSVKMTETHQVTTRMTLQSRSLPRQ